MAQFNLTMPKMGESVHEATIIKWLKNEGDSIELDEPVLEIATDKVDSEIPSPVAGILGKKLFNDGDVIQVGSTIAVINTAGEGGAVAEVAAAPAVAAVEATVSTAAEVAAPAVVAEVGDSPSGRFYSPLVKSIAKQENIGIDELEGIAGTGKDGRVTKDDIMAYLPNRGKNGAPAAKPQAQPVPQSKPQAQPAVQIQAPAVSLQGGDEIIEMDRMGKLIAEHMVMSKHVSPHVTSFVEADVTNIVMWRDRIKKEFEKREGEKITFTPIFIEAVCKAIKDFPMINISVDGTNIIVRKNINIGMATALPNGNLIVPVIKNVDRMNLVGITKAVNDLANRARNNKLTPDDISGGTYTLTNVGSFGNVMGTPIINQPQVAIMAVGAVRKKPAVIETPTGDAIAIRHMMFLSHSYDHRVVNGALGGQFVRRVADYLEQFDFNREF
jgi:2-oxoglutarate dehydrogenase E2 component (dihydrolipoamide succinyltransferase)